MLKFLIPALLLGAAPASAHGRHHQPYYGPAYMPGPSVMCTHYGCHFVYPRRQAIRIDEHCVYKPWKDKTVCKY